MKEEKSIFSKIVDRELSAEIVYENSSVLAFRDINPCAPIHVLVIPKKPIKNLDQLEKEDLSLISKIFEVIQRIAKQEKILEKGYRVILNNKNWGGQTVDHVHFHLLGGRIFQWPPG